MKPPAFFLVAPEGAYSTPHAAPRFNERTGESHAFGCRCEKCCKGSGCACYACGYVRTLRGFALRRDTVAVLDNEGQVVRVTVPAARTEEVELATLFRPAASVDFIS